MCQCRAVEAIKSSLDSARATSTKDCVTTVEKHMCSFSTIAFQLHRTAYRASSYAMLLMVHVHF